ncbi:MAG: hypothetical protein WB998_03870 [Solirubrobacteraceae bacterium]
MPSNTNRPQRRLRRLLAAMLISSGALMLCAGAAQAKLIHPYTGESFGPQGPGLTSFRNASDVAVDQSTGELYALDESYIALGTVAPEIDRFTATGAPVDFSATGTNKIKSAPQPEEIVLSMQIAVDASSGPAKGDIYFADSHNVEIFSSNGAMLGQLKGEAGDRAEGVAVDSTGAVYVAYRQESTSRGKIRKYVPTASPVTEADYAAELSVNHDIRSIAVDDNGNVYGVDANGGVERFTALQFGALEAEGTLVDDRGVRVAVDTANDHVYVDEADRIAEFGEAGELLSETGEEELYGGPGSSGRSFGVAVSSATGDIYASGDVNSGAQVLIYSGTSVVVPEASTEAPTGVTNTSAMLNGSVNPGGVAATYQFQYGATTTYGSVMPASAEPVGSDSSTHHVSTELTGLAPGSTYHYRIVARNVNGTTYGEDHTLYVHGPPTVASALAHFITQDSVELTGTVEAHGLDTQAHLEYGTSTAYGESGPTKDLGSEGSGTVYAEIEEGLAIDTVYHFRVVATNSDGTVYGPDEEFRTAPVATISEEAALGITSSSSTLSAQVIDYHVPVNVHFEYGATTEYGTSTAPVRLKASEVALPSTASLSELGADTTYHFRLVAEGEAGTVYGADATFTTPSVTAPSTVLPDGRGYEKVSPTANADGDVYQDVPLQIALAGGWTEQPFLVSPDGNAVAYMGDPSERGGTGAEGPNLGNQYVARRGADGQWETQNVEPPSSGGAERPAFKGFSSDLTVGFVNSRYTPALAPGAPSDGYSQLYAKDLSTGAYTPLITTTPEHSTQDSFGAAGNPRFTPGKAEVAYGGSSADLGHELFMANDALTPNAVDGGVTENNLYDTSGGTTTLVNVLPDGSTEPNATFGGPALAIDRNNGDNYPMLAHDISEDGSRIFWTDLNTGDVYVRENDTAPQSPLVSGKCSLPTDACTVLVAEGAQYWNATPDGAKVLYTKTGQLYEYDLGSDQTVELSPGKPVRGVVAASSNLSFVYFVADPDEPIPGAQRGPCEEGQSGSGLCDLYVVHVGEPPRFVATLSGKDNVTQPESFNRFAGDWQGSLGDTEAEVTSDGAHLLFTSSARPTGYASGSSEQVFLYDYASEQLNCLSCKQNGEPITKKFSAFLPVSSVGTTAARWMSDDGNRVFFDTLEGLVPQDINEATDVYEWERYDSGGCHEQVGCIYLLSDGTSPEGAFLIGTSTSGNDVFMTTRGKLVPEDENENIDVYDVRVGSKPPVTPPQCTGSGCQGVPATPPIFATPPSVSYDGVGNFEASAPKAVAVKQKSLSRAQKLARALKRCEKSKKTRRASCRANARRRYGVKKRAKSSASRDGNVSGSSGRGK